jgi:hypothetical protein
MFHEGVRKEFTMELIELMDHVAKKYGIGNYRYKDQFLALVGTDQDEVMGGYGFKFREFLDFVGFLVHDGMPLPIIWIKHSEDLEIARIQQEKNPVPYLELHVSNNLSATQIANSWLEALVIAGARFKKPSLGNPVEDGFLRRLHITLDDLSPESREFILSG